MGGSQRQLSLVLKLQDQASKELKRVSGELGTADTRTRQWGATLAATARSLAIVGTAAAGFIGYGVKIAADLETAQVGLETLLGSAEEADKTIARLKVEAARTPFELPGLTQATQLLTSVTKDGDRSIDILLDVGEALAAMGKGQAELDRIIVNLQQIAATGRAATIDIRQFAFAGIPIYEMLTETTGKSGEALEELISTGGVTFELLTQMFDEANDAGGRFFNAFKNQGGTFNQALSNMKDSFGIFLADIATGSGIFDGLTSSMMAVSNVLGDYEGVIERTRARVAVFLEDLDRQTGVVTLLKDAWANVVFVFDEQLKPALLDLWETLQPYKPFLEALVTVIGVALIGAIAGTVIILGALAAGLIQVLTWATRVADFILGSFIRAWDSITSAIAGTTSAVEALIDVLQEALSLLSRLTDRMPNIKGMNPFVGGLGSLGKIFDVNDAVITPRGDVIRTHPDDYIFATKNPGSLAGGQGPVHVHLNVDGREISHVVFDRLMGDLKANRKLA